MSKIFTGFSFIKKISTIKHFTIHLTWILNETKEQVSIKNIYGTFLQSNLYRIWLSSLQCTKKMYKVYKGYILSFLISNFFLIFFVKQISLSNLAGKFTMYKNTCTKFTRRKDGDIWSFLISNFFLFFVKQISL